MIKKLTGLFSILISSVACANLPYHPLSFPRDEAAHYTNIPYSYKDLMEWWYFNGKADTDEGKHLSFDVAFFNADSVVQNQTVVVPMLHIQVSDLDKKSSYGVRVVYKPGQGQISTKTLDIELKQAYSLRKIVENGKDVYLLHADGKDKKSHLKLDLKLIPISAPFLINQNGLMQMLDQTNSYYYTIPRFKMTGTLSINGVDYEVSAHPGDAWMDHQWGDFDVQKHGWEWFSVRLDNGLLANIFMFLDYNGNKAVGGLANIILPNGEQRFIPFKDFAVHRNNYWHDPATGINFPLTFDLKFDQLNLELVNDAAFPEQEQHGYWEGFCNVKAVYENQLSTGYSYTELVYSS